MAQYIVKLLATDMSFDSQSADPIVGLSPDLDFPLGITVADVDITPPGPAIENTFGHIVW